MWSNFLRAQFTFVSDQKYTSMFKNKLDDDNNNNNNNNNHNNNNNNNNNNDNNDNNDNNNNNNNKKENNKDNYVHLPTICHHIPLFTVDFPHPSFHPMVFCSNKRQGENPRNPTGWHGCLWRHSAPPKEARPQNWKIYRMFGEAPIFLVKNLDVWW